MARAHAVANKLSMSRAVGDLLRKFLHAPPPPESTPESPDRYFDPVLGIQVSRAKGPITLEDVQQAIDDEDQRILEIAGLDPNKTSS